MFKWTEMDPQTGSCVPLAVREAFLQRATGHRPAERSLCHPGGSESFLSEPAETFSAGSD